MDLTFSAILTPEEDGSKVRPCIVLNYHVKPVRDYTKVW
jgi:hypothetical protein